MRTKNAMQLKARINNRAKEVGVPAQMVLQNYLFERLLERLSMSPWREKVVVKGGMLIASLLGVAQRTTMDLDTTIQEFSLTHDSAEQIFREIISMQADDDWEFQFVRTEDIREGDDYPGIRVYLLARYAPMEVPLSVDVTTGDKITPGAVEYDYPLLFDDRSIALFAYPLETVLAEKLETLISRGTGNTRPRDFYDVHALWQLKGAECSTKLLFDALVATCSKRGSLDVMKRWESIILNIVSSQTMQRLWAKYAQQNPYAAGISFDESCGTVKSVLAELDWADWPHA